MKIDTNEIKLMSQSFVEKLGERIADCKVKTFQEFYFNSSEFRTKEVLKDSGEVKLFKNSVAEILDVARRADRLVRQNLTLALLYNLGAVPLAILGR